MEFIKPKVQLWGLCPTDWDEATTWIERAARVCYNSEDKIKPGSAVRFIKNILKSKPPHGSILEHSNLVLRSEELKYPRREQEQQQGTMASRFIFTQVDHGRVYIYGNYRAFYEMIRPLSFFNLLNNVTDFFSGYELVTNQAEIPLFAQAATVQFLTDRAVTHEIVRHRHKTAYSQRSQRYCNESNLQIVKPYWWFPASNEEQRQFLLMCYRVEDAYRYFKDRGFKNQEARTVLPNCTATTIVVTMYMSAWHWFHYLRSSSAAYPGIRHITKEAVRQMRAIGLEV